MRRVHYVGSKAYLAHLRLRILFSARLTLEPRAKTYRRRLPSRGTENWMCKAADAVAQEAEFLHVEYGHPCYNVRTNFIERGLSVEWQTTSAILERLRDFNDRGMWDHFTTRFRPPLVSFGCKLGLSHDEAEDAAQEILLAFTEAYRKGKYDRHQGRLSSWLFGIAYRQIANARRKQAGAKAKIHGVGDRESFWGSIPDEREASNTWDYEWEQSLLNTCLRQVRSAVSVATFRAFEMVALQERTPAEAAAALGMSRDAVYVARHRVLKRIRQLRRELEEVSAS